MDSQARTDFAADWDAWHQQHQDGLPVAIETGEQIPYEAKDTEA